MTPQIARLLCPPLSPGVCSNSCPVSWCCYLAISSPATRFSLLPTIFPRIRVFSKKSVFHISGQSIRVSASPPVLLMNIQGWFPWFDLLPTQGTLKIFLKHHSSKASILRHSAFFMVHLSHPYMINGKAITLTIQTFVSRVTSLLFNTLSRLATAILPRSKHILISRRNHHPQWFWSPTK